jgi:hypothetical protein
MHLDAVDRRRLLAGAILWQRRAVVITSCSRDCIWLLACRDAFKGMRNARRPDFENVGGTVHRAAQGSERKAECQGNKRPGPA